MNKKRKALLSIVLILVFTIPYMSLAQKVGVFYDAKVPQIKFAAEDIKTALETKKFSVEMLPLTSLKASYPNKKVVLALESNSNVTKLLQLQGGKLPSGLGEQAYALRTTNQTATSFWVLGGDANGTMYGGLQIAENINFYGFKGEYNSQESPSIAKRGIKLNLPFDKESNTYGKANSGSTYNAISNVWDMTFWITWFDEMARDRYNVISIWNNHPFTSMIKMADYPDVAIQNVTGLDDKKIKTMSIDQKIVFWKQVMAYAHSRGFEFYLFNWNIWTDGATGKYGITDDKLVAATNEKTMAYMRKCMSTLLETYPDLDGFGITAGEHMSKNEEDNAAFLGKTYGLGIVDYAKQHPERKFKLIHRWHLTNFEAINTNFKELMKLPNITFDMSFKYSLAHMYSTPLPQRMQETHEKPLRDNHLKSWLTLRNDDFYYHNWGDPNFTRVFINGMINKGDWFAGFNMGSDGFSPTRTFFSKNSISQGVLEVQRQWYMFMLWGRLAYNPSTTDEVFKKYMAFKYPTIDSDKLFTAWSKASSGLPVVGDLITGTLGRDNQWWPEACQSSDDFLTIDDFSKAKPNKGSTLCSIAETASGNLSGKKSAYTVADEIESDAIAALSLVNNINADSNTQLGVTINNIKAMSYLTIYYAYKIRGATYFMANNKEKARNAMATAYCWWMNYANSMDSMYQGMNMQRTANLSNWHVHDQSVQNEYTNLGGSGTPSCDVNIEKYK
jgi:hypothetical protein